MRWRRGRDRAAGSAVVGARHDDFEAVLRRGACGAGGDVERDLFLGDACRRRAGVFASMTRIGRLRPARVVAPARVRGRRRAHAGLRRPLYVGRERAVQGRHRLRQQRVRPRRTHAGGRHPARPGHVRHALPRGRAGRLPHPLSGPRRRRDRAAAAAHRPAARTPPVPGRALPGRRRGGLHLRRRGLRGRRGHHRLHRRLVAPVARRRRPAPRARGGRGGGAVAAGLDLPHRDGQRDRRAHDLRRGPPGGPAGLDRRRAELQHACRRSPTPPRGCCPSRRSTATRCACWSRTSPGSPARSSSSARSAARTTPARCCCRGSRSISPSSRSWAPSSSGGATSSAWTPSVPARSRSRARRACRPRRAASR